MKFIATFENARQVVKADAACLASGVAVAVETVPEDISAECGMCLSMDSGVLEFFKEAMRHNNIKFEIHAR